MVILTNGTMPQFGFTYTMADPISDSELGLGWVDTLL